MLVYWSVKLILVSGSRKTPDVGDKLIPPLMTGILNPHNRYINPYYGVHDHPQTEVNNGGLDPSTCKNNKSMFFAWGAQINC